MLDIIWLRLGHRSEPSTMLSKLSAVLRQVHPLPGIPDDSRKYDSHNCANPLSYCANHLLNYAQTKVSNCRLILNLTLYVHNPVHNKELEML